MANPEFGAGAFQKAARGTARHARLDRRARIRTERDKAKAASKARDRRCRWPHKCRPGIALESAHLVDLSRGGDDSTRNLITLCADAHRGMPSLHSKDWRIDPLTSRGADGPCAFYARNNETGAWEHVASERAVGVMETRA